MGAHGCDQLQPFRGDEADAVDLLLISPERLNNPQFRDSMLPLFAGNYLLTVGSEIAIFVIFAVGNVLGYLISLAAGVLVGAAAVVVLKSVGRNPAAVTAPADELVAA